MKRFKEIVARIYDLPNAYRVLDIMDEAGGCDIYETDIQGKYSIKPKWYVTEKEAKDLRDICLYNKQYKNRSKIWKWIIRKTFPTFRDGCRIKKNWV